MTRVDQTMKILDRARAWVADDERVRAALVHGSAAKGDLTPLSDLDLIIVAEPGRRDAIWAEREQLTRRLLGADPAQSNEVPHQRPYRWQARTADLDMLDLTVDEGAVDVWIGLAGPVDFLVDRADVRGTSSGPSQRSRHRPATIRRRSATAPGVCSRG